MTGAAVKTGAVALYLAMGAAMSYLVWGPWEGVDPRPFVWWTTLALALFHVLVGFAIGRWWALALPFVWALVSIGAEGYDIPVTTQLVFQAPFLWIPALAVGVAARRFLPRLRSRSLPPTAS
jgi:hypothetical protein